MQIGANTALSEILIAGALTKDRWDLLKPDQVRLQLKIPADHTQVNNAFGR